MFYVSLTAQAQFKKNKLFSGRVGDIQLFPNQYCGERLAVSGNA
jgi:hypothetical protein